ncbi:MAG: hypothetical protein O7G85_16865 [Planctomycetota bacterium]|nr:hypothetical protein [Planctomycetota bacterium]
MTPSANIRSIEALRALKVALVQFDDSARQAMGEAKSDVMRAVNWLQNDRAIYWKQQLKYRQNRLADAKSELMRAEMASETKSSAVVERKLVQKWKMGVEEAEQKLQHIKKWLRIIEHESIKFRAECQPLVRLVETELPKAYVKLDRLYTTLEKYLKMAPPGDRGSASSSGSESSGPTEVTSSESADGTESERSAS